MPAVLPSGRQFELAFGEQRATIVEVGGGLRSYRVGDTQVVDGYGPEEMASAGRGEQLLPWPNRIDGGRYDWDGVTHQLALTEPALGNAIHGLVRWGSWTVRDQAAASVSLTYRLHPQPGYPFSLDLAISYELGPGGLSVRTRAENIGAAACPFGAGAHPYLAVPGCPSVDDAVLTVPAADWYVAGERQIPRERRPVEGSDVDFRVGRRIGATVLDTAFGGLDRDAAGRATVTLDGPDGRRVALWVGPEYDYLMLFTGDPLEPARRRRALAVEPMTCPPNAFRTGEAVVRLEPGAAFAAAWGIAPPGA